MRIASRRKGEKEMRRREREREREEKREGGRERRRREREREIYCISFNASQRNINFLSIRKVVNI